MTLDLSVLANTVLSANRKGLLRNKPIFKPRASTSSAELSQLEEEIETQLPSDFRNWLLTVGYGDINGELSLRREWLASIESGQLAGSARFAQDNLGNFYAFDGSGCIFFLSRSEPVYAEMTKGFLEFIEEIIKRDYKLLDWVRVLETKKYDWR